MNEAARDAKNEARRAAYATMRNAQMSRRETHKMMRDLRNTLRDIKKFEERDKLQTILEKEPAELTTDDVAAFEAISSRIRREPGETVSEYVARRDKDRREALLNRVVPERKCPVCGKTRVKSRSWVRVSKAMLRVVVASMSNGGASLSDVGKLKKKMICCLSCWRTRFTYAPRDARPEGEAT